MFGIGMPELIVIFFVALIVLGPKKLPEIAKALGKGIIQFKRVMNTAEEAESEESGDEEKLKDESSSSIESEGPDGTPGDREA